MRPAYVADAIKASFALRFSERGLLVGNIDRDSPGEDLVYEIWGEADNRTGLRQRTAVNLFNFQRSFLPLLGIWERLRNSHRPLRFRQVPPIDVFGDDKSSSIVPVKVGYRRFIN